MIIIDVIICLYSIHIINHFISLSKLDYFCSIPILMMDPVALCHKMSASCSQTRLFLALVSTLILRKATMTVGSRDGVLIQVRIVLVTITVILIYTSSVSLYMLQYFCDWYAICYRYLYKDVLFYFF